MKTTILLDAAHDLSAFCHPSLTRLALTGLHLREDGVEATNGGLLLHVPYADQPPEEYPSVGPAPDKPLPGTILPPKALVEALRTAPRSSTLPILAAVRVTRGEKIALTTTDLDNDRTITTKPIDAEYPDSSRVEPHGDPVLTITLSAQLLKTLATWAEKHGTGDPHSIRFEFFEPTTPARFTVPMPDGRQAKGLLCPMR